MDLITISKNEEFIKILNEYLTENQKRIYTESFSAYLQHDFVVDLEAHWKKLRYFKATGLLLFKKMLTMLRKFCTTKKFSKHYFSINS